MNVGAQPASSLYSDMTPIRGMEPPTHPQDGASHPHVFPFYLAQSKTPTQICPEVCLQGDQAEDSISRHSMGPDTGGHGSSLANWGSSQCQEVAGCASPVHLLLPVPIASFSIEDQACHVVTGHEYCFSSFTAACPRHCRTLDDLRRLAHSFLLHPHTSYIDACRSGTPTAAGRLSCPLESRAWLYDTWAALKETWRSGGPQEGEPYLEAWKRIHALDPCFVCDLSHFLIVPRISNPGVGGKQYKLLGREGTRFQNLTATPQPKKNRMDWLFHWCFSADRSGVEMSYSAFDLLEQWFSTCRL